MQGDIYAQHLCTLIICPPRVTCVEFLYFLILVNIHYNACYGRPNVFGKHFIRHRVFFHKKHKPIWNLRLKTSLQYL